MKKRKLIWLIALVGALVFGLVGCTTKNDEQTGIALDKTELTVTQYDTAMLTLENVNESAEIVWSSSNAAVATVENGVIYGWDFPISRLQKQYSKIKYPTGRELCFKFGKIVNTEEFYPSSNRLIRWRQSIRHKQIICI